MDDPITLAGNLTRARQAGTGGHPVYVSSGQGGGGGTVSVAH